MEMQLEGLYIFAPLYFVIKWSLMDGFFSWRCLYDNNEVYFYASIKNNIKSNVFDLGTEI